MGCAGGSKAEGGADPLAEASTGRPPVPQTQTHTPLEPVIASHTETFMDKVEKLRAHFDMDKEQPVAAVVARTALGQLGLVGRLEGASLVEKANACLALMPVTTPVQVHEVQPEVTMTSPVIPMAQPMALQMGMPLAEAVDEQALLAEAKLREAEPNLREAEARIREAEQLLVCVFGSSYLRPNRGLEEERHDRRTHDRHLGGLVTTPKNLP